MGNQRQHFTDTEKHILSQLDNLIPLLRSIHAAIEQKAQYNFTLMSSVATILAAFNISFVPRGEISEWMTIALIVFAGAYICVAVLSLLILYPQDRVVGNIVPTHDQLEIWWSFNVPEYIDETTEAYVQLWQLYDKPLRDKSKRARRSFIGVIVGLGAAITEAAIFMFC